MSAGWIEPGELWASRDRDHIGPGGFARPKRVVKILGIRHNEGLDRDYVDYEYIGGQNARLRNSHKLDTFVQKYERTQEAEQ